jgi:hypothetical protein
VFEIGLDREQLAKRMFVLDNERIAARMPSDNVGISRVRDKLWGIVKRESKDKCGAKNKVHHDLR